MRKLVNKGLFKELNKFYSLTLGLFFILFITTSCIQDQASTRSKSSKSSQNATTSTPRATETNPTFNGGNNFFQNGENVSSGNFILNVNFIGSFFMRGPEIDNFIRRGNQSEVKCLVSHYPNSIEKKIMVVAANPQFFFDFTKNSKEYYYYIDPNNELFNKTFCQKTGIINSLNKVYTNEDISYSIDTTCPNCITTTLRSDFLKFFDKNGGQIKEIISSYLNLTISYSLLSDNVAAVSCTSTSSCQARGFDCCSLGQCVKDGQIKSGTNQSSDEFIQSISDILNNPSNIRNYPHYYFICGTNKIPVVEKPEELEEVDENLEALLRFRELEELFRCVNPIKGEMSICSITYPNISLTSGPYLTGLDDRNFKSNYSGNQTISPNSIVEVSHGEEIIFKEGQIPTNGIQIGPNNNLAGNDNFSDTTQVTVTHLKSTSALNDTLKIKYKIDGTCEELNEGLATCKKLYLQGQNTGDVDDHFPASNIFEIPFYADLNRTITIRVNNIIQTEGIHWKINNTSPPTIEFVKPLEEGDNPNQDNLIAPLQVFDDDLIEIKFFVNSDLFKVFESKKNALNRINELCDCGGPFCNLKPKYAAQDFTKTTPIDYLCVYPPADLSPPPLQQVVSLSSKSVPQRYYDTSGAESKRVVESTSLQEGIKFEYLDSTGLLKPNNVDKYVGFNEIYGSMTFIPGSAKPPSQVQIKAGSTYDLFVDSGSYSSCFFCGTDYYSTVVRLFPRNFLYKGGGYLPDPVTTSRLKATEHRADDMLFGRACWLPATMIPWTHNTSTDAQSQRLSRLASQHFLFSNGYQRDWYGFDYGSVIGSFDGTTWFSVGTQRRIKATTNKLYLAINGYFGDLTSESTYRVIVSDASSVNFSGSSVTEDLFSDGAQCKQYHICNTDLDCVTQLGWEYMCSSITNLKANFPNFDVNGFELASQESVKTLIGEFKASRANNKRCIYRGKGSPCSSSYKVIDSNLSYVSIDKPRVHACGFNYYCQNFSEGVPAKKFNNKIARWGKSVKNQNISNDVKESNLDTFGLGVRSIGRPIKYIGDEEINNFAKPNLIHNRIGAICLPGRNPYASSTTNTSLPFTQSTKPDLDQRGDRVSGIGLTPDDDKIPGSKQIAPEYFSSCGILDSTDNFFHFNPINITPISGGSIPNLTDGTNYVTGEPAGLIHYAGNQAMSTNALKLIEALSGRNLLSNFDGGQITNFTLEENRCMRGPGSPCFSDFECAPNNFISQNAAAIDPTDPNDQKLLNEWEIRYWQEELVCGQLERKEKTNANYKLNLNKCCREVGLELSIATLKKQKIETDDIFFADKLPGIDIEYKNKKRYSRMAPAYKLMSTQPISYPALITARADACADNECRDQTTLQNQWKTLQEVGVNTCCSGHFVRKFDVKNNGADEAWNSKKHQSIDKNNFRCLNWRQCNIAEGTCGGNGLGFDCDHVETPENPSCLARNISLSKGKKIFEFLELLELTGVPQISIHGTNNIDFSDTLCAVNHNIQSAVGGTPIPNTILSSASSEYDDGGKNRLSAADETNFAEKIKMIWDPNKFRCCLPAGTSITDDTLEPSVCCTGFIANNVCALPDYTDLSVYFNKYISSESKNLSDELFEPYTGYLLNDVTLQTLACQRKVCASGKIAKGVALSTLPVSGHPNNPYKTRRFVDGDDAANKNGSINELYDAGLKLNKHFYCVPAELATDDATGLSVIDCNIFPAPVAQ